MNTELGTGNFVISPERGALFLPEIEKVTNLHYCKNHVFQLGFYKSFKGMLYEKIFEEFISNVIDDGEFEIRIKKLCSGEIDKIDSVFNYNFVDDELHRLHFILQKEIIDGQVYFLG